jgi:hypothetical protein
MTEDDGLDLPSSRPRGRPVGSRDSYQRTRRKRIPPTPAVRRSLYTEIHELIDIAEKRGQHKAVNRGWKHLDQKVDEAEVALLHKVMEVIEDETSR